MAAPLRYGDVAAFLTSFFVASGAMLLLGLILERRLLKPQDMALAFTFGDPALAISIGFGVNIIGSRQPCGVVGPPGQFTVAGLWLLFGLWQWRAEVKAMIYTRQQALGPTKIWHQLVIYPTLGTWLFVAAAGGLMNAQHAPISALLMISGFTVWIGTYSYDTRHPRLGHPPYDWSLLRPVPPPWSEDSVTLRSGARNGIYPK